MKHGKYADTTQTTVPQSHIKILIAYM